MDIKISDNWLREFLKTKETVKKVGEQLALSGPSVEKITRVGKDSIYDIEITTNRVDCMSIIGIAREGYAILADAKFEFPKVSKVQNKSGKDLLHIKIDPKLVKRVIAVVMEVENGVTPKWMKERLENAGMRSLNRVVDVTNYVMMETGHPTHVFDYDKIEGKQIIFRPADKNEEITTFDGKTYKLPGDDVVVDDGEGVIIDLPGIIGLKNSVVSKDTKRIVFFINSNDPHKIRKTSTRLGIRTNAAIIEEKGVDPELATLALWRGLELYRQIAKGKIMSKIYDIYPSPYKPQTIKVEHEFIERIIGISIEPKRILEILEKLGFKTKYDTKKSLFSAKVPSWRANDVTLAEDIVEEVARIYGYYNLPSVIMDGQLPAPVFDSPFDFENKVKQILKSHGGVEVYTNSLVPKDFVGSDALRLKNPLGEDTKYLRTSLKPSLINATYENLSEKEGFYLFEMANIYKPRKNDLPNEVRMVGIIFSNYSYRKAKGIVEALYQELHINKDFKLELIPDTSFIYFEESSEFLRENYHEFAKFVPIPKYPAQIEDITLTFPAETKMGEVLEVFERAELTDVYEDSYTFRVWYQDSEKTLTDEEVEKIRNKYLKEIKDKFGGSVKS